MSVNVASLAKTNMSSSPTGCCAVHEWAGCLQWQRPLNCHNQGSEKWIAQIAALLDKVPSVGQISS